MSLVSHVQVVGFDDTVEVLTPILAEGDPENLLTRIGRKSSEGATISAGTISRRRLGPIGRFVRLKFAAVQQPFRTVSPKHHKPGLSSVLFAPFHEEQKAG